MQFCAKCPTSNYIYFRNTIHVDVRFKLFMHSSRPMLQYLLSVISKRLFFTLNDIFMKMNYLLYFIGVSYLLYFIDVSYLLFSEAMQRCFVHIRNCTAAFFAAMYVAHIVFLNQDCFHEKTSTQYSSGNCIQNFSKHHEFHIVW